MALRVLLVLVTMATVIVCMTEETYWFRFKVSFSQAGFNVGICSVLFQNTICSITDQSVFCRCTHDARGSALLYRQFNQSGRSVYTWNWSDSTRKQVQKKTQISFDVESIETTAGGDNLNIIFFTIGFTAAVIILLIIIVVSIYVYRRRKALGLAFFTSSMISADSMALRASLVLVTMSTVSVCGTEETCADVEFPGYKDGETVRVLVNSYVNLTFHLNTSNCTYSPDWFRFKVSFSQAGFNVGICSVLFQNTTCSITDQSVFCRCTHDARGSALLYRQFNQSGRSVYTWNWSDSSRKQVQKKTQISFDVEKDTNGSTHDSTVTSAPGIETKTGGDNMNVIFVTSATTAVVIILPVIIVISIYVYRRRKDIIAASTTRPSANDRLEENPDTAPPQSVYLQGNRRLLKKEEYEYSEIADIAAPRDSSPVTVHENYEHPLQDEGEGQSDYSRLVYKGLWRNGNGHGNDNSNTKMVELSLSGVATTEQQAEQTVTRCLTDEYLEPVPTAKGT